MSSDKDEASFLEYHSSMTFGAIPFSNRTAKDRYNAHPLSLWFNIMLIYVTRLSAKYRVLGIPSFVIVGSDGEYLNGYVSGTKCLTLSPLAYHNVEDMCHSYLIPWYCSHETCTGA